MIFKQNIEFELGGPGPPGRTCTPKTGYFHATQKPPKQILQWLFTAKDIAVGNVHCFSLLPKSLTTFNPQSQNFELVL